MYVHVNNSSLFGLGVDLTPKVTFRVAFLENLDDVVGSRSGIDSGEPMNQSDVSVQLVHAVDQIVLHRPNESTTRVTHTGARMNVIASRNSPSVPWE